MIYAGTWERDGGLVGGIVGLFSSITKLITFATNDTDFEEGDVLFVWEEKLDEPSPVAHGPVAVYTLKAGEWSLPAYEDNE